MALIRCPECGKEISDKAPACIHCGYPLDQIGKDENKVDEDDRKLYKLILKSVPKKSKVKAIKIVNDINQKLSLAEAKRIVDTIPQTVITGLIQSDAIKLQKEFIAIGSVVEIIVDENTKSKVDILSEIRFDEGKQQERYVQIIEDSKPRCPTCGSTNIQKITSTKRWLSTSFFGLASSDVGKTMECKSCGYKW